MKPDDPTSIGPLLDRVISEVIARRLDGEDFPDELVRETHPDLMPRLADELLKVRRVEQAWRAAAGGRGDAATFIPPVIVDGYTVLRQINHGGQAVIYLARQLSTGCEVALKVLRAGVLADAKQRAWFEREAQILTTIDHPNVVSVLDRGETRDGQLYLAMNYIAGEPLDPEKLALRTTLQERLHLFVTICRAVDEAHRRGIVHRDLKPANVRLDANGQPHVLDFGLATDRRSGDEIRATMTVTGQFLGSFLWASPEQQRGDSEISAASDVYSLGVMLHQLATAGRFPPHVYRSVKRALEQGPDKPRRREPLSGIDPKLAGIIERCLAPIPTARYASAGALGEAVEGFLSGAPHARDRWRVTSPMLRMILLVTLCTVVGAVALYQARSKPAAPLDPNVNGRPVLRLDPSLDMVWIPPGEFWMGSPETESGRLSDETRHRVRIERGFYMLRCEVPQALYEKVTGTNPSRFKGASLPVESVTWVEARNFCDAYSTQIGRHIRLPTEAEWEYACRAGTTTKYSFGDDDQLIVRYANLADASSLRGDKRFHDGYPNTAPVFANFLQNPWGLVQMHGNVWEWCDDPYQPYPRTDSVTIDHVPTTMPADPFSAVARGGSWYDDVTSLRAANRCAIPSETREVTVGFRIVCDEEITDPGHH